MLLRQYVPLRQHVLLRPFTPLREPLDPPEFRSLSYTPPDLSVPCFVTHSWLIACNRLYLFLHHAAAYRLKSGEPAIEG